MTQDDRSGCAKGGRRTEHEMQQSGDNASEIMAGGVVQGESSHR